MRWFALRRLALAPFVLLGMTCITFLVSQLIPIDPVAAYLGGRGAAQSDAAEQAIIDALNARWGWDKPIPERYWIYLTNLLQGDMGESSHSARAVSTDLANVVPPTMELVVAALLVALVFGIPLGVFAAARRGGVWDEAFKVVSTLAISVPVFWLAIVGFTVFYGRLGWAAGPGQLDIFTRPPPEVTGMVTVDSILARRWDALLDTLHHLAFPALVLGLVIGFYFARVVRSEMADALESDYVRTARGKGLRRRLVLYRHALRNAVIPVITLSGLAFGSLLTGIIVVEHVVGWPGLGQYAFTAATRLDLNAIAGVVLVISLAYVLANLAVDLLYTVADPRVRDGLRS